MEYNKLKNAMNKRRIPPKLETWRKLDAMLEENDVQVSRRPWFGLVASVAAFILTTTIIVIAINNNDTDIPSATLQPRTNTVKHQKPPIPIAIPSKNKPLKINYLTSKKNSEAKNTLSPKQDLVNNLNTAPLKQLTKDNSSNLPNAGVEINLPVEEETTLNSSPVLVKTNELEEDLIYKPNQDLDKAEVEAATLLRKANSELEKYKNPSPLSKTNPKDLLRDAEWDARVEQDKKLAKWLNKKLKTFTKDRITANQSAF